MHTLGIDLSADRTRTAACRLRWGDGRATLDLLDTSLGDDALLAIVGADEGPALAMTAISAPFGWPRAFVAAVGGWQDGRPWPGPERRPLQLRATDEHLHRALGRRPQSVSADRIASTAMRCAWLLGEVAERRGLRGPVDRATGADGLVEAHPASALHRWSTTDAPLPPVGHKDGGPEACGRLLAALEHAAPWLELGADGRAAQEARARLTASDDALDALVCALVARAGARGTSDPPPVDGDDRERARCEGWIALPAAGSLAGLADDAPRRGTQRARQAAAVAG